MPPKSAQFKSLWLPMGFFALAGMLSLIAGPSRAFGLRMPQESSHSEDCHVSCTGSVIPNPPTLSYAITDVHVVAGKASDPTVPVAKVTASLLPQLQSNVDNLQAAVACATGETSPIKQTVNDASVLAASQGPTLFTYAHGNAQIGLTFPAGHVSPVSAILLATAKLKIAPPDFDFDPIVATTAGAVDHSLKINPDNSSPTSYGAVYGLVSSDSNIRDLLEDGGLIAGLKKVIEILEFFLPINTIAQIAIDQILGKLLNFGTQIEQKSEYNLSVDLNAQHFSGGTSSSVNVIVDDGAEVTLKQINRGTFFVVKSDAPEDRADETVKFKADATSSAKATGIRGDAISAVGDMWAYMTLMCCPPKDDGTKPEKQFCFVIDDAEFDLQEMQSSKTDGKLPRLKEHEKVSKKFIAVFKAGVKAAQSDDCKKMKANLQALHGVLSGILNPQIKKN